MIQLCKVLAFAVMAVIEHDHKQWLPERDGSAVYISHRGTSPCLASDHIGYLQGRNWEGSPINLRQGAHQAIPHTSRHAGYA